MQIRFKIVRHPLMIETLCQNLSVPKGTTLHESRSVLLGYLSLLVEAQRDDLRGDSRLQYVTCLYCEAFDSIGVHPVLA